MMLDSLWAAGKGARVQRQAISRSATQTALLLAVVAISLSATAVLRAAMPFSSATVTRVENQVKYGQVKGSRSETRLANPQDVVKASDFLLSEKDSRAELKYPDGSIVRIGQNTVFTFDANTRTLTLERGTFVAYIPKGSGGATIKTPSYTAAITGTTIKVSGNRIAATEGTVALKDKSGNPLLDKDGKPALVTEGFYAEFSNDGELLGIYPFSGLYDGLLMTWNGRIGPPVDQIELQTGGLFEVLGIPNITFEDAQNAPSAVLNRNKITIKPQKKETDDSSTY